MPTDRSPLSSETEVTVTPTNLRDQVGPEILNLPSVNPLQMGESSQINSNEFRLLKLPTFWHKQPKLWFAQIESEFVIYRIRSDDIKYSSVIRHLDEQALISISEIIENPPATDKYNHLKNVLINRFTDSEEKRLRQLLAGIELNDKKPSELLREIRQLSGGSLVDNILHSIWLQRLPYRVQATLAVVEDVPLSKLAELADKIIERDNGFQVSEVNSRAESKQSDFAELERRIAALEVSYKRSRSRSRNREKRRFKSSSRVKNNTVNESKDKTICFYHNKFGDKAKKCTIPCAMSKSLMALQEN